jgi:hypothetical protein
LVLSVKVGKGVGVDEEAEVSGDGDDAVVEEAVRPVRRDDDGNDATVKRVKRAEVRRPSDIRGL